MSILSDKLKRVDNWYLPSFLFFVSVRLWFFCAKWVFLFISIFVFICKLDHLFRQLTEIRRHDFVLESVRITSSGFRIVNLCRWSYLSCSLNGQSSFFKHVDDFVVKSIIFSDTFKFHKMEGLLPALVILFTMSEFITDNIQVICNSTMKRYSEQMFYLL